MHNQRIACVLFPDFAMETCVMKRPVLRSKPLVLTDNDSATAQVVATNNQAGRLGVTTGMTASQAHTLCPDLTVAVRNIDQETNAASRIFQALQTIGPGIEKSDHASATDAAFFLEASGLHRLYQDETGIAKAILAAVIPFAYTVAVGLADNKFVARVAAEQSDHHRYTIVPRGTDHGAWLRRLHVNHLPLSDETRETLHDLGIKTIGQAAAFPANEIARRFGDEGARLSQRAQGNDPEFFIPRQPDEDYRAVIHFDFYPRDRKTILAHIESILQGLFNRLHRAGLICRLATIVLQLEDHRETSFNLSVEHPTLSVAEYLRQLNTNLEQQPLKSAVTDITVTIPQAMTLLLEQLPLDRRHTGRGIDPHAYDIIENTLGRSQLCAVIPRTSHLPEGNFHFSPVSLSSTTRKTSSIDSTNFGRHPYCRRPPAGLRLITPPRLTEVVPAGDNTQLFVRIGRRQQAIRKQHGPWKLSGGWWQSGFDRQYYEFWTEDSQQYLVFFDRTSRRWFLQGIYD